MEQINSEKVAVKVSVISIVVNLVLSIFKLIAGLVAHSNAMISDAVHSASDVFSTFVVIVGVKISAKEADEKHQYGHERLESVAEHIFGVQMLAIAMQSEFEYEIDLMKVIFMLAIHELGETIIGDLTRFQISREEKKKLEQEAVHKILSGLLDGKQIEELFLEFDTQETAEAKFAYQCDKLECDLQCKLYDEEGCVDLNNQEGNSTVNDLQVRKLLQTSASWSEIWLKFGQQIYPYDENFRKVSEFAMNHKIRES